MNLTRYVLDGNEPEGISADPNGPMLLHADLQPLLERVETGWLIWSNEHDAWWGRNRCGYYTDIDSAGRYSLAEAHEICVDAGMCNRRKQDPAVPAEVVVPSPELIAALLSDIAAARGRGK